MVLDSTVFEDGGCSHTEARAQRVESQQASEGGNLKCGRVEWKQARWTVDKKVKRMAALFGDRVRRVEAID